MIKKLIYNLWIFVLGYISFGVYEHYMDHAQKLEDIANSIPSIEKSVKSKEKKVSDLKGYFSDISNAKERIERVAGEVEKIQRKFPSDINDSYYIKGLKEFTRSLNMKKVSINAGAETDQGFYFTKDFKLVAHGTYLQFLILLEKIGGFEKLLNISDISFKEISEKQKGRFQVIEGAIQIEAYRYDPNHKEDRGIRNIESGFDEKKKKKKKKKRSKR